MAVVTHFNVNDAFRKLIVLAQHVETSIYTKFFNLLIGTTSFPRVVITPWKGVQKLNLDKCISADEVRNVINRGEDKHILIVNYGGTSECDNIKVSAQFAVATLERDDNFKDNCIIGALRQIMETGSEEYVFCSIIISKDEYHTLFFFDNHHQGNYLFQLLDNTR